MSDTEKTSEILDALIARSSQLIWATEPQLGAERRRIDFWTLHPHEGKGHVATSYEIKVSRSDFKRDTDIKQREARLYSDQFYYVTPPGLVAPQEIPDWAGLQEWSGRRFITKIHAPNLSKSTPSWGFVTSLIRTCAKIRRDDSIAMRDLKIKINSLERGLERASTEINRLKLPTSQERVKK